MSSNETGKSKSERCYQDYIEPSPNQSSIRDMPVGKDVIKLFEDGGDLHSSSEK